MLVPHCFPAKNERQTAMMKAGQEVEVPSNNIRFQIELEFIQCLASPAYLNFLAINRYFDNPAFMNYLQYLKYWKQPQYAKYIVYPHCLAFLDLLEDERFRQMIQREDFMTMVHAQQFYHWQTFLNNRMEVAVELKADADADEAMTS